MEYFNELKLDNGLYVAFKNTPTKTIAGFLRVYLGALHGDENEEGLAHFLEHTIVVGGTKKYNPNQIKDIISNFGDFGATTHIDRTIIPVSILSEDIELYLDFVSDAAFNPQFDKIIVNEERQRVLREIADFKSKPYYLDEKDYGDALFRDHPKNIFVGGREEIIKNTTIRDLRKFHSKGYNANNMELILVGDLPKNIETLIRKYFDNKPTGENIKFKFPKLKPLKEKKEIYKSAPDLYNKENPKDSSASFDLAFIVPSETDKHQAELRILSDILGGGFNSRLFKTISQKNGLAYSISSKYSGDYNAGFISIGGEISSYKREQAIDAVFEEFDKLRTFPVELKELGPYKKRVKYGIAKAFETNGGYIHIIETYLDLKITPEQILGDWERVTPDTILDLSQKYLPENRENGKYVLLVRDPLL